MSQPVQYSDEEMAAWKRLIAPNAPDHIVALVLHRCAQLGCDPAAKMLYPVNRKKGGAAGPACPECGKALRKSETEFYCWKKQQGCGKTYGFNDAKVKAAPAVENEGAEDQWTLQSSIDFFRSTAESSDGYAGQDGPYWCGSDGQWVDVWLSETPPAAAKIGILRSSFTQPLYSVAKFSEYAATNPLWTKMPALMIAKCAEALGIRRAFPSKLSGIYIAEEMDQAGNEVAPKVVEALPTQPVALPAATVAPTVANATQQGMDDVRALGKQIGKLAGAVNGDLQKFGGDVLALKAEYEKQLADKIPRGPDAAVRLVRAILPDIPGDIRTSREQVCDALKQGPVAYEEIPSSPYNAPAVNDGGAVYYQAEVTPITTMPDGTEHAHETVALYKSDAPESEKTQAVIAVMSHAGFEREYPVYADKMKVCSEVLGRHVTKWSELEPADCTKIMGYLQCTEQGASDAVASEAEIRQLQNAMKDAKFIEWLKTSKAFKAAQADGKNQADSLRDARLAFAGHVLGHAVASFNALTQPEAKALFAKFQEMRKK